MVWIRPAESRDADGIARIYNHYVKHSIATFEEQQVSVDQMAERVHAVIQHPLPWLVAETDDMTAGNVTDKVSDRIIGYAYACPWKTRSGYRYTVEVSVYVDAENTSAGLGTQLYQALFAALKKYPIHSIIGGIALPNDACVALHEKMGFKQVAHFKQTGYKFDQWIDVTYWQLNKPLFP